MVTFVSIKSDDQIIFAIFNRFDQEWKTHFLHTQLDITEIQPLAHVDFFHYATIIDDA